MPYVARQRLVREQWQKTNNEPVTLTVIEKICEVLQCDIGDVVQIVDIEKQEKNNG